MSSERRSDADQDRADAALLSFDVDDTAIEIAATGAATIPTASVNLVPPNCCTDRPVRLSR